MDRRMFLKRSAGSAAIAATAARVLAAEEAKKEEVVLKIGSQAGRIPGKSLRDKVLQLQDWGGVGLELGGGGNVKEIQEAIKGTNVKVSACCWGSAGGSLVSPDKDKRENGIQQIKNALKFGGEVESTGVIFVPCFNGQSTLKPEELDKVLADILPAIGDYAVEQKCRVLLEPLNVGETFYLRRLEQAAAICSKLNHPGICMMGDFYHMCKEEKDDEAAFVTAGKWLHHVHLASRARNLPGQDDRSFVAGFRGLKKIGYQDYCSLECGVKGKPEEEIPKSFRFLEQQWKEATI